MAALTDQKWRHNARYFAELVHPENDQLLEVVQDGNEEQGQKVRHGHVQQEKVGRLKPEKLVPHDDDDDGQVADQPDQCDDEQI